MFRSGTLGPGAGWPVLAAWCCAHVPLGLAVFILSWSAGARHFDHQERLREQVAVLLHHRAPAPAVQHLFAGPSGLPAPHPAPDRLSARWDAFFTPSHGWVM